MAAITATWGTYAPIDFQNQGDCSGTIDDAWIPIELVYRQFSPDVKGGAAYPPGMAWRWTPSVCAGSGPDECSDCNMPCQIRYDYGDNRFDFEANVVHEVGHVLGLIDESERGDFPDTMVCGGITITYPHSPENSMPLTASPDFESIMSDWRCSATRSLGANNITLSSGDVLAITMLYPWSLNRTTGSMGSTHGMYTASGVVIRADGSATTDVYARGAHPDQFYGGPSWTLYRAGGHTHPPTGLEVSASNLSDRLNDLEYSYTDYVGRTVTGRAPVIKDTALHTAVLSSAIVL